MSLAEVGLRRVRQGLSRQELNNLFLGLPDGQIGPYSFRCNHCQFNSSCPVSNHYSLSNLIHNVIYDSPENRLIESDLLLPGNNQDALIFRTEEDNRLEMASLIHNSRRGRGRGRGRGIASTFISMIDTNRVIVGCEFPRLRWLGSAVYEILRNSAIEP